MTRSLVEREVISDHLVKEITIEYLMARGERPYRILRGGSSLWETHVPAMRLALVAAIQSVEGGVQVAAKQESCPESAPRTETAGAIYSALSSACIEHSALSVSGFNLFGDSKSIKAAQEWLHSHSQIGDLKTNLRHWRDECGKLHAQLTKTPSADHDDGNLRGLAAPNHQPHAVSQGWQPIETAPKDGTRIIAVGWDWGIVWNERHVTTVIWRQDREGWCESDDSEDDSAYAYLTHWMPLPAPPSPAKTDPAPSSVEER